MIKEVQPTIESAKNIDSTWKQILSWLKGFVGSSSVPVLDTSMVIPGTIYSFDILDKRISVTLSQIRGLDKISESRLALGASQWLVAMTSNLNQLAGLLGAIRDDVTKARTEEVRDADQANYTITTNVKTYNIGEQLRGISAPLDNVISNFTIFKMSLGGKGFGDYSDIIQELNLQRQDAQRAAVAIHSLLGQVERDAKNTVDIRATLTTAKEQGDAELKQLHADAVNAVAALGEIKGIAETARRIANDANTIQQLISDYQPKFSAFDQQLEARQQLLKQGIEEQNKMFATLAEFTKAIQTIQDESKAILGTATTAGLAGVFRQERDALSSKVAVSQIIYYFAIAVLFLLIAVTIYPVPYISSFVQFPPLVAVVSGPKESETIAVFHTISAITLRFLFILPGLLLVGFSQKRYTEFFLLREHYSHKYSIAASVNGFEQQAPEHQQAIAAATFDRLLYNPAESVERDGRNHRSRASGFVVRLLQPAVQEALRRLGFAPKAGPD